MPADSQHHIAGIVASCARPPLVELLGEIGGGLCAKRRIGWPKALALLAMARRAGWKSASGVTEMVQPHPRPTHLRFTATRHERHAGVIAGYRLLLWRQKLSRDRFHFGVAPAAARISLELRDEIASIQSREAWGSRAIATPIKPVAGDACLRCTCVSAAERNQLARGDEAVRGSPLDRPAGRQQQQACRGEAKKAGIHHLAEPSPHGSGSGDETQSATTRCGEGGCLSTARALLPLLLAASCKSPPDEKHHMPQADPLRGRAAIERVGCAACHRIPGIAWPQGGTGPSLEGFAEQGLIAGKLSNRPDVLTAFVRNAPAVLPGTSMPAMPLSDEEASDVAAYLYASGER